MIRNDLLNMQDLGYRDFHARLVPTLSPGAIIGVRTPMLRAYAKKIAGTPEAEEFLAALPHEFYEENNLHAFLTEKIVDFDRALAETERFLPYIDNWATCDSFLPKAFVKNKERLIPEIKRWLKSEHVYTVRYAAGLLMKLYLDEAFLPEYPELLAGIRSEEYYINMMLAWYFQTALVKQHDTAIRYIEERRLSPWVHNKAIQKSVESRRISPEMKEYLKSLKIK